MPSLPAPTRSQQIGLVLMLAVLTIAVAVRLLL